MAIKRGDMVKVIRAQLEHSLEAQASDPQFSPYIFETPGEVMEIRGDYAFIKFGVVPTPNIWLKLEQLEAFA